MCHSVPQAFNGLGPPPCGSPQPTRRGASTTTTSSRERSAGTCRPTSSPSFPTRVPKEAGAPRPGHRHPGRANLRRVDLPHPARPGEHLARTMATTRPYPRDNSSSSSEFLHLNNRQRATSSTTTLSWRRHFLQHNLKYSGRTVHQ